MPFKPFIAAVTLAVTFALAFSAPRTGNQGTDFMASFNLPNVLPWHSEDIAEDPGSKDMGFLGRFRAREYDENLGPLIYLYVLDAGNFGRPMTSVGGAGFKARELPDIQLRIPHHTWSAKAVYFEKNDEGFLTVYWVCVNKEQLGWADPKLVRLWYSLFNNKKTGVMVRVDITTTSDLIGQASQNVQELLAALASRLPPEQQDYLFGK